MKKTMKFLCCCALSLATVFSVAACGKKKTTNSTNKTTQSITTNRKTTNSRVTTSATTTEDAAKYSVNVKTIDDVTYNIYSIVDGKKTLDASGKKYKANDKVILEVVNRSSSNLEVLNGTNKVLDVKSNIKGQTEEITITNDLSLEIKQSDKVFIDFNPFEIDGITFEAAYTGDNNTLVTETDDFFVRKNTKVYFYVVNDSYNSKIAFIKNGNLIDKTVSALPINPYTDPDQNPVKTCFDEEGIAVTDNLFIGYVSDYDKVEVECNNYVDGVSVAFDNKTTGESLEVNNDVEVNQFNQVEIIITNPSKKDLMISATDYGFTSYFQRTNEDIISLTFDLVYDMSFYIEEYKEYDFVYQGVEGVDAYFYYIDEDGIEIELKSGDKCPHASMIDFVIDNNTKYNATISVYKDLNKQEPDNSFEVLAKASIDSKTSWSTMTVVCDYKIVVTLASEETKLYKVTIDDRCQNEDITARLGYFRNMYDYPEADINKEYAEGTALAAVFSNGTDYNVEMALINTDTGEEFERETLYGYGKDHPYNCASTFSISCNVTIVIYPIEIKD